MLRWLAPIPLLLIFGCLASIDQDQLPEDLRQVVRHPDQFSAGLSARIRQSTGEAVDPLESIDGCWGASLDFGNPRVLSSFALQRIDWSRRRFTTLTYQVTTGGLFTIYGVVEGRFDVVSGVQIQQIVESVTLFDPLTGKLDTQVIDDPVPVPVFILVDDDHMLFIEGETGLPSVSEAELADFVSKRTNCAE